MSGNGRGGGNRGNRKPHFKRKDRDNQSQNRGNPTGGGKKTDFSPVGEDRYEKRRGSLHERPKWVPPRPPTMPIPTALCAWCGKQIKEISTAISDPDSGQPVHFDCIIDKIVERENLETGDTVSYIGNGRFGIVHYNNPPDTRDFKIKKIYEWENRENRAEWRTEISDRFSFT